MEERQSTDPLDAVIIGSDGYTPTKNPPRANVEYFALPVGWKDVAEVTQVFRRVEDDEFIDLQRFAQPGVWVSDHPYLAQYAVGFEPASPITDKQALTIIRGWLASGSEED